MNYKELSVKLKAKYSAGFNADDEKSVFFVTPEIWLDVATYIKENPDFAFDYLMCITSYDKGDSKSFGVAYNLYSLKNRHYIECRVEIDSDTVKVPSVTSLWKAADWHEREAYDMMGIEFEGHPDLKRILLPHDWEGHPLRKDYKEAEYYHGLPIPKDKTYWE